MQNFGYFDECFSAEFNMLRSRCPQRYLKEKCITYVSTSRQKIFVGDGCALYQRTQNVAGITQYSLKSSIFARDLVTSLPKVRHQNCQICVYLSRPIYLDHQISNIQALLTFRFFAQFTGPKRAQSVPSPLSKFNTYIAGQV